MKSSSKIRAIWWSLPAAAILLLIIAGFAFAPLPANVASEPPPPLPKISAVDNFDISGAPEEKDALPGSREELQAEHVGDNTTNLSVDHVLAKYRAMYHQVEDQEKLDPPIPWYIDVDEYTLLARACLLEEESIYPLLALLASPDYETRMRMVQGLVNARRSLFYPQHDSIMLWQNLVDRAGPNAEHIAAPIIEALYDDSGIVYNAHLPGMLSGIPEVRHLSQPHLVWCAKNWPEPDTRVFAMNALQRLDPQGQESLDLFYHCLGDESGHVRLNALQGLLLRPIKNALR